MLEFWWGLPWICRLLFRRLTFSQYYFYQSRITGGLSIFRRLLQVLIADVLNSVGSVYGSVCSSSRGSSGWVERGRERSHLWESHGSTLSSGAGNCGQGIDCAVLPVRSKHEEQFVHAISLTRLLTPQAVEKASLTIVVIYTCASVCFVPTRETHCKGSGLKINPPFTQHTGRKTWLYRLLLQRIQAFSSLTFRAGSPNSTTTSNPDTIQISQQKIPSQPIFSIVLLGFRTIKQPFITYESFG